VPDRRHRGAGAERVRRRGRTAGRAVIVNPYDLDGLARALGEAVDMPVDEQRSRMRSLRPRAPLGCARLGGTRSRRDHVTRMDEALHRWPRPQMPCSSAWTSTGCSPRSSPIPRTRSPSPGVVRRTGELVDLPVSGWRPCPGRRRDDLAERLIHPPVCFSSGSTAPTREKRAASPATYEEVMAGSFDVAAEFPGAWVEEKRTGLTLHGTGAGPPMRDVRMAEARRRPSSLSSRAASNAAIGWSTCGSPV
jgi:hypothetical protein